MSPTEDDITRLFPDLRSYDDGRGITAGAWLNMFGRLRDALMLTPLFWPVFKEHDGCLLWADFSLDSYESWMESTGRNRTAVESVMNHRHVTDLFLNDPEEATQEQVEFLGSVLREMWEAKLRRDFPHLSVQVDFHWQDREASDDAQLYVYLNRA